RRNEVTKNLMDNEPTNEKEVCSEPRATAPLAKYLFCSFYLFPTKKDKQLLVPSRTLYFIFVVSS
ncbi:hypothetical protein, partial [Enterococcus faecium]|uniref:hypothetical protein n=1 Tax=Enterococcus faecium TaxID=1352 RepID=UPI00223BC91C